MEFLIFVGLQSPNTLLAVVSLIGTLTCGLVGVFMLGDGIRLNEVDPDMARKNIRDSYQILACALSFLIFGSLTVLIVLGIWVGKVFWQSLKIATKPNTQPE